SSDVCSSDLVAELGTAVVDGAGELLGEERVALRPGGDVADELLVGVAVAEQGADERHRVAAAERLDLEPLDAWHARDRGEPRPQRVGAGEGRAEGRRV